MSQSKRREYLQNEIIWLVTTSFADPGLKGKHIDELVKIKTKLLAVHRDVTGKTRPGFHRHYG